LYQQLLRMRKKKDRGGGKKVEGEILKRNIN
jgi:hypothetical protein